MYDFIDREIYAPLGIHSGRWYKSPCALNCAVHLIVMFSHASELLTCYVFFKEGSIVIDLFTELPYSKLSGNFIDEFTMGG